MTFFTSDSQNIVNQRPTTLIEMNRTTQQPKPTIIIKLSLRLFQRGGRTVVAWLLCLAEVELRFFLIKGYHHFD